METSSMASLWKSLVVVLLFSGYIAAAAATADGNGTEETQRPPIHQVGRFGFGFLFPWNPQPSPVPQFPGVGFGGEAPPENGGDESGAQTNFLGSWKIHSENAGVSAMHIQLMPNNNKAVWYDSTGNGLSEIESNPPVCRKRVGGRDSDPPQDCTAHAIEYDIDTAQIRTLNVGSSPWCSSGGLSKNGDLISTGGDKDGYKAMRILKPCGDCDFQENPRALFSNRWYATNHALPDGSFIVVGGRGSYNYEIVPPDTLEFTAKLTELDFLGETEDDGGRENNLFPFVNLLPDGNLFVFANYKSIILNPYTGETVRQLPDLPGGSRNYPPSGMSALLPIDLAAVEDGGEENSVVVEVLVCGGNTRESYRFSDLLRPRKFLPAFNDCGRLRLSGGAAAEEWEKEDMPSPRVMGDMLLLPTGDVLMLNGAKAGTSAWNAAAEPNLTPVLYSPDKEKGDRFRELAASEIPRMYHSVSAVLPDGDILVAGSNTNAFYMLKEHGDRFTFPTELRVEKFSPPYMAPELEQYRLEIAEGRSDKKLSYGGEFSVAIEFGNGLIKKEEVKVTMYSPPFTTHGYSMNQRLLILKVREVDILGRITVVAPPSGKFAPPGYYLVFVVHRGVPSRGMWVHIQ
ncbi:hypothetical protein ABFS82_11G050800 [Erythranthe guttata]|uniref:Galactose oxidase-like Early set domain-containing protein n=1 Tax=Erythranthe guttata TaxID=4155 RepID=A0A022QZD2_ERYGU|nr:hypothetical protein MIMGU_mgv1a002908mg [Erythranthe guttata]